MNTTNTELFDNERSSENAALSKFLRSSQAFSNKLLKIRVDGIAALERLLPIAQGNSGQCRYVAHFLLGLYNGYDFPFNLSDLRGLDENIIEDCLTVLRMNCFPEQEIYKYVENGHRIFEDLAKNWNIKN